jgi:hypothetical protein
VRSRCCTRRGCGPGCASPPRVFRHSRVRRRTIGSLRLQLRSHGPTAAAYAAGQRLRKVECAFDASVDQVGCFSRPARALAANSPRARSCAFITQKFQPRPPEQALHNLRGRVSSCFFLGWTRFTGFSIALTFSSLSCKPLYLWRVGLTSGFGEGMAFRFPDPGVLRGGNAH